MTQTPVRLLAIEDDPVSAGLLKGCFIQEKGCPIDMTWAATMKEGLQKMEEEPFDVVVLDLQLPDSGREQTLERIPGLAQTYPLIIYTSHDAMDKAREAIRQGAQEFIVKGAFTAKTLTRAVMLGIDRYQSQKAIFARSQGRQPDGFDNTDLFFAIGHKELQLARRRGSSHTLVLFRIDTYEEEEGVTTNIRNELRLAAARKLGSFLRSSDVVARIDEDTFAILALDSDDLGGKLVSERLRGMLDDLRMEGRVGHSVFDPKAPETLEQMYEDACVQIAGHPAEKSDS